MEWGISHGKYDFYFIQSNQIMTFKQGINIKGKPGKVVIKNILK